MNDASHGIVRTRAHLPIRQPLLDVRLHRLDAFRLRVCTRVSHIVLVSFSAALFAAAYLILDACNKFVTGPFENVFKTSA